MTDEELRTGDALDGPCTGGCLMATYRGGLLCVRCGLEFSDEASWRESMKSLSWDIAVHTLETPKAG